MMRITTRKNFVLCKLTDFEWSYSIFKGWQAFSAFESGKESVLHCCYIMALRVNRLLGVIMLPFALQGALASGVREGISGKFYYYTK